MFCKLRFLETKWSELSDTPKEWASITGIVTNEIYILDFSDIFIIRLISPNFLIYYPIQSLSRIWKISAFWYPNFTKYDHNHCFYIIIYIVTNSPQSMYVYLLSSKPDI